MRFVTAIVVAGLALAGCGGGDESGTGSNGPGKGGPQAGADSPEAAWKGMSESMEKKDWKGAWRYASPDSRKNLTFIAAIVASFSTMSGGDEAQKQMLEIGKKHGIPEKMEGNPFEDPVKAGDEMLANVKDPEAAFIDLMTFAAKSEGFKPIDQGELKDVKTEGDKATGKSVKEGKEKDVTFQKIDGRWCAVVDLQP